MDVLANSRLSECNTLARSTRFIGVAVMLIADQPYLRSAPFPRFWIRRQSARLWGYLSQALRELRRKPLPPVLVYRAGELRNNCRSTPKHRLRRCHPEGRWLLDTLRQR